ncbi:MAG: hypothetical protein FJ170_09000 [Gammaproteobacteria bacterium]|nr:hypothetical protein [Gammaproteobacteria bacterium]
MAEARKLNVVLCWHMHQPDYRDIASGEFTLPWTYLHAIKDHTDMAAHLEQRPGAKAVFNFVPVLLDQLNDYAEQFASGQIRDPLLASLAEENMDRLSAAQRKAIFHFCFACNHERMVHPYPAFRRLHEIYKALASHGESQLQYLSGQYLADLVTWYHLTWTGETVRRDNELVARLMSQGSHFTHADRRALFDLIGELISGLIPRYRRLLEQGRISLSATPHFHPLAPLMLDFDSAREAWPDVVLPESDTYPGGRTRVIYHIESAREAHLRRFGQPPQGVWPAEGAISTDLAHLFAEQGFSWTASGEGVLANSLRALNPVLPERHRYLYHPYRISDG